MATRVEIFEKMMEAMGRANEAADKLLAAARAGEAYDPEVAIDLESALAQVARRLQRTYGMGKDGDDKPVNY